MKNSKKKIALIGYGGTITMVVRDNKVMPADDVGEILAMVPAVKDEAHVDYHILSDVDSTNVVPDDWTKITYFIAEHMDEYDAFVVTHGTNTMSYTAGAVELALGAGMQKPVVFTGSQLPLTVYGNDARFNLEHAVRVAVKAAEQDITEVMLVFADLILRASRSVKVSESAFRAFGSPAYPQIGQILSTGIYFSENVKKKTDEEFSIKPHFEKGVLTVDLSPGQSPSLIEEIVKSGKCKGLILKSHGAGSVPSLGEYSFLPLIERCRDHYKVPVVVATKFLGGNSFKEVNDAPAIEAIEAGAISSKDMTDVMTEVKLMWVLGQGQSDVGAIKDDLWKNYSGEIS